ncbi:STAS domain-containing protein [Aldersonia kunmingensis]|uniref:STAS domain-containing protein n=1 Tax=Aldersonia kunmingensis TaxID=408066 RepID=UPI000829EBEA|nr:STAS domain-containing protein [Aldersonia kunmingensis]
MNIQPLLEVESMQYDDIVVLRFHGVLDSRTYLQIRETITKCSADSPQAIVVNVDNLAVPADSAWAAFTSARWQISRWVDVPLVLVAASLKVRETLRRNGITRWCPCYSNESEACRFGNTGARDCRYATAKLPITGGSSAARTFVGDTLTHWSLDPYRTTALVIATEFVENTLQHTPYEPTLRLEYREPNLTVAVADDSSEHPVRREDEHGTVALSGLGMVTTLSTAWGSTPRVDGGKVVWAVIGPRDVL